MAEKQTDETNKRRVRSIERIGKVSICAPGVRTVRINSWTWKEAGEWKCDHEVSAVLGFRHAEVRVYSKIYYGNQFPHSEEGHKKLIETGWTLTCRHESVKPLIVVAEIGEVEVGGDLEAENEERTLVACPWPPEEDEKRLAVFVEDLYQKLRMYKQKDRA